MHQSAKFLFRLLSICIISIALPAMAVQAAQKTDQVQKVYKSVGPNGQIIYSDQPSPGSTEITVPVSGGYQPVPPPAGFQPYKPPSPKKRASDNKLTITQPANKATIRNGEGTVTVSVSLSKGLRQQQTLVYQIDGKTLYTGTATSHTFNNVFRGTHVLTVQLTNGDGSQVSSQSVTIYMKRPFKKK